MIGDVAQHLKYLRIARIAECALSAMPAWLWSGDGIHLLWVNAAAARALGLPASTLTGADPLRPADPHRRQAMQVARRVTALNDVRLERLPGFGAALGGLTTLACTRLPLDGGDTGLLLISASAATPIPFERRLHALIDAIDLPVIAFAPDNHVVAKNTAAAEWRFTSELQADPALLFLTGGAFESGHALGDLATGNAEIFRVGTGGEATLVAVVVPSPACAAASNVATHADRSAAGAIPEPPIVPDHLEQAPLEPSRFERTHSNIALPKFETEPPSPEETEPPMSAFEPPATPADPIPVSLDRIVSAAVAPSPRKLPLRFMWRTDADGHFELQSDEFARLIGPRAAVTLGRPWRELASQFNLDPQGRVASAIDSRSTLNSIAIDWPVDDAQMQLPVELSGVPFHDGARQFAGYRGFGLVRDLDALSRLDALRAIPPAQDNVVPSVTPDQPVMVGDAGVGKEAPVMQDAEPAHPPEPTYEQPEPAAVAHPNVVPFRSPQQDHRPTLTPVENSAFNELARQLSARLDDNGPVQPDDTATAPPDNQPERLEYDPALTETPGWLAPAAQMPKGHSHTDLAVLDRISAGVLIYRLDRLLYANRTFLDQIGYPDLQSLNDAGGLDALYVEPGVSAASSTSDTGTPVRISAPQRGERPVEAALHTIMWDNEQAMALICSGVASATQALAAAAVPADDIRPDSIGPAQHAAQEETHQLRQILDAMPDAVLVLGDGGHLQAANRTAREMFGLDTAVSNPRAFGDLFAPENRTAIQDAIEAVRHGGAERSREVLAHRPDGSLVALSMTLNRTAGSEPATFAVLRDLTLAKTTEAQLLGAQRQADRAASVKADVLARISHEIRTPLNSIIGFADVMIGERFGALGNERYVEYLKDIRASGERVIAIINDMLDLSHIETGKLDLTLANQNLNSLVEQCVGVMQPQANRERIIIRTSLARGLPWVMADARALRQIAMNLIGNSIHLANAGGQVIVSTALTDFGDVVLRVRDTGQGLNDNEMAAALAPFRAPVSRDDVTPGNSGVSLSLTKALVEANRAHFQIRSSPQAGTLIEVRFPGTAARVSSN